MLPLEPYEKEEAFMNEIRSFIDRFCREYQITYAQVVGTLEFIKNEMIQDGFSSLEEEQ